MTPEQAAFEHIYKTIKKTENYVPRNWQTIGGMWTVETWMKDDVTLRMMDEGYTRVIQTEKFKVVCNYKNDIIFESGDSNTLIDRAFDLGLSR